MWSRICVVLGGLILPFLGTGVASAASPINMHLECVVVDDASGEYTAVIGYSNSSPSSVTVPYGADNKFTPTEYDGNQPTTFLPGRHRAVFSVVVRHPHVKWMLNEATLVLDADGTRCPPPTEMPEEGNGTGPAVGLLVGGLVGFVLVQRARKRTSAMPTVAQDTAAGRFVKEGDRA